MITHVVIVFGALFTLGLAGGFAAGRYLFPARPGDADLDDAYAEGYDAALGETERAAVVTAVFGAVPKQLAAPGDLGGEWEPSPGDDVARWAGTVAEPMPSRWLWQVWARWADPADPAADRWLTALDQGNYVEAVA